MCNAALQPGMEKLSSQSKEVFTFFLWYSKIGLPSNINGDNVFLAFPWPSVFALCVKICIPPLYSNAGINKKKKKKERKIKIPFV